MSGDMTSAATAKPSAATEGSETESRGNGSPIDRLPKEHNHMTHSTTSRTLDRTVGRAAGEQVTIIDGAADALLTVATQLKDRGATLGGTRGAELRRLAADVAGLGGRVLDALGPLQQAVVEAGQTKLEVDVDDPTNFVVLSGALEDYIQSEKQAGDSGARERLATAEHLLDALYSSDSTVPVEAPPNLTRHHPFCHEGACHDNGDPGDDGEGVVHSSTTTWLPIDADDAHGWRCRTSGHEVGVRSAIHGTHPLVELDLGQIPQQTTSGSLGLSWLTPGEARNLAHLLLEAADRVSTA